MNKLQQTKEFWRGSQDHDRLQIKLSAAIGGAGLFLSGVGVVGIFEAPIEGAIALAAGAGMSYFGAKDALKELDSFEKTTRRVGHIEMKEFSEREALKPQLVAQPDPEA